MQAARDIRPLTSLRFFAAAWVVLYHYWPNLGPDTPALVARGYLGVVLFFVLSGFILCHVYLDSVADGDFRYLGFLWARLARIYPLHLATLLGVGLMAGGALALGFSVDRNVLSWTALPANLLLVHAWGLADTAGWNHPSWSISAEWFAYLCFPAFAGAALKLRSRPRLAAAAALGLVAAAYWAFHTLTGKDLTHATIAWGALRIVPCFALGCAVNLLWRAGAVDGRTSAAVGAALSLAVILALARFGAPDALIAGAFGMLILALASLSGAEQRWAGASIFVYLGEISYAIYMVCIPWKLLYINVICRILKADKAPLPLSWWLLFLVSLIPLAALAHNLIERPARGLMRRWTPPISLSGGGVAKAPRRKIIVF